MQNGRGFISEEGACPIFLPLPLLPLPLSKASLTHPVLCLGKRGDRGL